MAAEGIPLVAISAQNEPNYQATWDTCLYTPAQLVTFVRDFLGPALAAQNLTVPVMAPETQGWDQFARFADPLIADSATVGMLGPIATHHYGGSPFDYAPAKAAGKVLWQTEVSDDKIVKTLDSTIDSGLRVAAMIHDNLVQGNVSAWHYWWLMPGTGDGNGALTANMTLLPRAYVLGNWSRFVRPASCASPRRRCRRITSISARSTIRRAAASWWSRSTRSTTTCSRTSRSRAARSRS